MFHTSRTELTVITEHHLTRPRCATMIEAGGGQGLHARFRRRQGCCTTATSLQRQVPRVVEGFDNVKIEAVVGDRETPPSASPKRDPEPSA
jgi:hypothetical protein